MPYIILPATEGQLPKTCEKHKAPSPNGEFLSFEVTETEHTFWKGLNNQSRTRIRKEAFDRCFYEVLHDEMGKTKRMFHE